MGMGAFAAGVGLAGADPAYGSDRTEKPAAAAVYLNGDTLDYELDENNQYREVHPIDAEVWIALRVVVGWIRSVPGAGQTLGQIAYIDKSTIQRQVEDRVNLALASLLARGAIRVVEIIGASSVRGRIDVSVLYSNLLAPDKRPKRVSLT